MFLTLKPFTPPRRYTFKDPDTGFQYAAKDRSELVQRIVTYRAQNKLEQIDHLNLVLENYWCMLPENAGACSPLRPIKEIKRGFFETLKGGIALLKNVYYGEENIVSQSIADERSKICSTCPYNVFPDKTDFIAWSDELAEASVGPRRSKHHKDIGNCSVCSCPLRAKVWYKGPFSLPPAQKEQMIKVNCWQPKVSSQNGNSK